MGVLSLNDRAMRVADQIEQRAGELDVLVERVVGARVIDAGVEMVGSVSAGVMLARACLVDLATVNIAQGRIGDRVIPSVIVNVNHPVAACMASQYAGWQISVGKFFAMGSGPMRASYGKEDLYEHIGLTEHPGCAVGVLEAGTIPDRDVIEHIAKKCAVATNRLTLMVAKTASLAGGVQVAARSVETAMHKLHELKFDLRRVVGGFGSAPLAPVAANDMAAIGRTNDSVLYGGEITLYLTGDDESIREVGEQLPSSASDDYGKPFGKIFKQYDNDFYKIDPMLFSPAQVVLQNLTTGNAYSFGATNPDVLMQSFFG